MNKWYDMTNTDRDTDRFAVQETDRQFFEALIRSDESVLDQILSDDFIIIDVMKGAETTKQELIGAIKSGYVQFEDIGVRGNRVRLYDSTAVITGQTQMTVRFSATLSSITSRYTHVYCELEGEWRLVSAQGTSIQLP